MRRRHWHLNLCLVTIRVCKRDCDLITNYRHPSSSTPQAYYLQWVLHNTSCATVCSSLAGCAPATAGLMLHKVKHTQCNPLSLCTLAASFTPIACPTCCNELASLVAVRTATTHHRNRMLHPGSPPAPFRLPSYARRGSQGTLGSATPQPPRSSKVVRLSTPSHRTAP